MLFKSVLKFPSPEWNDRWHWNLLYSTWEACIIKFIQRWFLLEICPLYMRPDLFPYTFSYKDKIAAKRFRALWPSRFLFFTFTMELLKFAMAHSRASLRALDIKWLLSMKTLQLQQYSLIQTWFIATMAQTKYNAELSFSLSLDNTIDKCYLCNIIVRGFIMKWLFISGQNIHNLV